MIPLLAACAIKSRQYSEPTDISTATLVFKNRSGENGSLTIYDGAERCSRRFITGTVGSSNDKRIRIRADQALAFTASHGIPGIDSNPMGGFSYKICQVTLSFVPVANSNYEATLTSDTTRKMCFVDLKRAITVVTTGVAQLEPVEIQHKKPKIGMSEDSDFCD